MNGKKFRTEEHEYTHYHGPVEQSDEQLRLGDVFEEVLANFIRFGKGHALPLCPFFSRQADCCAFDELAHVLSQSEDRQWANKVRALFVQMIPLSDGRRLISACGDDLTCNGLKIEDEPGKRTLIFREIIKGETNG